ncbi:MAG: hypothetical protein A3K77_08580, partial [Euryarchaeota archaeon RBG_13_31_8]
EIIGSLPATYDSGILISPDGKNRKTYFDQVTSLECRNCNQPIIVIEEEFIGGIPAREKHSGGSITWKGLFWWPFSNMNISHEIPSNISKILQEAKITYSAQCYKASAVMSRRTLEAITAEKGEDTGTLAKRIENLKAKGILDKNLADWATEIRLLGNSGAHFDPINEITKEDANQIIIFIEEFIKYVYIIPSEISRREKSS